MAAPAPESPPPALGSPEVVTSSEVVTSVVVSVIAGFLFLAAWAFFRAPLRHIYVKRVQLPDARFRPPPLRLSGLVHRCAGFLAPVFLLSDGELVQTAGLDALMLTRFLVLGLHIFVPLSALCCAVLIPLCMTGTAVENAQFVGTSEIMRFTLSNVEQGSPKLWASFALSYAVLAWVGYCLYQHYKSYALFRLLHLRITAPAGSAPLMHIVGSGQRGWPELRDTLLKLLSPYYMVRCDTVHVRKVLEEWNAAEAAEAAGTGADKMEGEAVVAAAADSSLTESEPLLCTMHAADTPALKGAEAAEDGEDRDYSSAAVLPWWLPPEQIPREFSAAGGASGVIAGKTCPTLRKRVLARSAAGRRVWVNVESYAVLFTTAGPPPSRELWGLLHPEASAPSAVVVAGSKTAVLAGYDGEKAHAGNSGRVAGTDTRMSLVAGSGEQAGSGAEEVAAQLTQALQDLFPSSFTQLVRVYNHHAVDVLLSKHEAAATKRAHLAAAVARARGELAALQLGTRGKAAMGDASQAEEGGKKAVPGRRAARAAARLERAEAALAEQQSGVEALEEEVEAARQAALKEPLGTAFIALFSDQTVAATAATVHSSLVSALNFNVRPCPGPDNLNWPALWTTWGQRAVRAVAVVPFLAAVMLFPIGVLTGVLSNLNTAVCGGTPETNSLYWPWYCSQTDFGSRLLKNLLQGLLPSLLSMLWDTYVLPMAFYFSSQSELCHLALSDLDRRMTSLFFNFNIFNTFLGSVLGGALFQQIGNMVQEPGYWLTMLGTSLPTASTYFLNYIAIHALSTNVFRFIWPHEGTVLFVMFRAIGLCRPQCERDHAMIRTAPSYRSARHFGSFLLIFVMALPYAVVAPLVLPAAAGFFLTAWITWRYCALYFYERSYESGGRLFEALFTLMVWVMALFTIFTSAVLAAKKSYTAALVLQFTQLFGVAIYHKKVCLSVGHYAHVLPLHSTLRTPRVHVDPSAFLPPPLRKQAVGWYPEWGKVWEKYGISRYSL